MQTQDFTSLSEAQKFHAFGILKQWTIEKTPMADTWRVYLGRECGYLIAQRDKTSPRQFKTVDAALSAVQDIGFLTDVIRGA